MTTDLISGVIPLGIDVITACVQMVKSGQIRALAVTSRDRSPLAPDVPSVVELGLPQLVAENDFGVSAPAGLPADVRTRLSAVLAEIVARPEVARHVEELGVTSIKMSSTEYADFVARQIQDWAHVIRAADAKP